MAKVKKVVIPVPKDQEEAAQFLAKLGAEQQAIKQIQDALNLKVGVLTAQAAVDVAPHEAIVQQLLDGLFAFAEAYRSGLTDGGKKKTVEWLTGIIGWRTTPPAVSLHDVEAILKNLETLKLERFIRTKKEVDKEAMLKEPGIATTVNGVSISQHEEFFAKPLELGVEVVKRVRKPKAKAKS